MGYSNLALGLAHLGNDRVECGIFVAHIDLPCALVCLLGHACQKGELVAQVADTERLKSVQTHGTREPRKIKSIDMRDKHTFSPVRPSCE